MPENYTPSGSSVIYTVPQGTDTADGPKAFQDFADSVYVAYDSLMVSEHFADVTLAAHDEGTMLAVDTVAANADVTVTVPDNATVPLPVGFTVAVANLGGGGFKVKLAKGPGVVIQDQGFLQVEDYRITTLVKISTNFWLVQAGSATYTPPSGPGAAVFDEGASTGATFSTLTDPDGDGKNYRLAEFSVGSGSLAIADEGYAETLIVAGGGGGNRGGGNGSSGGGAGGALETIVYLDVAAHSVEVGAGGTGAFTAAAGQETTFAGQTCRPGLGGSPNSGGGGGAGHSGNGYWSNGGGGGSAGNGGVGWAGGCCNPGGAGVVSSITGTAVEYAQGGVGNNKSATPDTPGSGGGGGYDSWADAPGGNGYDGIVYVRVEI